ncbi:MAG: peptidase Ste24p [Flavipsychrobacter sp.]|jgi:predicted Zn-dependent protease|nr:peptidase Ste24p [Flavipsychrobacter sp.]
MKKIIYAFGIFLATSTLYSCYKNPITGRSTLNLVDESTMRQMANKEYVSFLSTNQPVRGTRDAEMVARVGSRLASSVQQYLSSKGQSELINGYQWEFNLVNNNQANAWCMPGGKVVVYSGLMPIVQNEAGLAVVMGHEIAHAIARHSNERASQQMAAQFGGQALGGLLGSNPGLASQVFMTAVGVGSQVGLLKFSRDQETEADQMGLIFMAMAGYNPNESIAFWQRMSAQSGRSGTPELLRTHPSDSRRIADLQRFIPTAMQYYKAR